MIEQLPIEGGKKTINQILFYRGVITKISVCRGVVGNIKFLFVKEDIVSGNIAETIELLFNKNNNVAYKALQELQKESEETDSVYPYIDRLSDMLDSDNSYIRTRGLTLLACYKIGLRVG